MKSERAYDVQLMLNEILERLQMSHVIGPRLICMRSYGAQANAYARIWSLPEIWRNALEINPFYIVEVVSEEYDKLPEEEKKKILIHELLHIPKKFTGGLVPHKNRGRRIDDKLVNEIYQKYLATQSLHDKPSQK
ncbi:metallopeptidase [Candidatus Micrarchaeota archaeon]|nr:metallopeptidase [Candidatus Micrarchaeota archaeon]MBD3418063.1 metallopeptidase [Candidatus Micrarchaeota archaeon]